MMQAMHLVPKGFGESIIEMHRGAASDHVNIAATQELEPFSDEVSNSHVFDSGVGQG
jgi:hypothetical protein